MNISGSKNGNYESCTLRAVKPITPVTLSLFGFPDLGC